METGDIIEKIKQEKLSIEEKFKQLKSKYNDIENIVNNTKEIKNFSRTEDVKSNYDKIKELQNKYSNVIHWREEFYENICEREFATGIIIDDELKTMCKKVEVFIKEWMDKQSELL